MKDRIMDALEANGRYHTAGALTLLVGRSPGGLLGTEPNEDVAAALAALERREKVVALAACPSCGLPGRVWTLPGDVPGDARLSVGLTPEETAATMEPLIADGAIEVGERVELIEADCCVRSQRPWRSSPRPA